jgi:long-chain acyl-CoA synthetase
MLEQFRSLVTAQPDAVALIEGISSRVISRAQLLRRAAEIASDLSAAGVRDGDVVAVQLPNSVDFVASVLAALDLRLVIVLIDRDAPDTEVGTILSHLAIKALIYRSGQTRISTRDVAAPPPLPAEARLIKLSSGSTGKPKGIVTSEENLKADYTNICATMVIGPDDINFGAIPFSHSYGFSNLVMPLLQQGTPIVISNDYIPQSILDLCNRHRCTVVPAIPMVYEHLASLRREDGDFHTVRTFISAGAPLPPSASRRFRERFRLPIHSFYGCSECGGITYDREGAAAERGTVGLAMYGVRLSIDDSRLTASSATVALGYLHDAETFVPFEKEVFRTDDLVEVLPSGEVALVGRIGDLINTAGKKVNPREIEQIILQIEGVRQAKVYAEPAGARGDVVAAAVVASPDVTRDQIRKYCRERLSAHKVPRIVKLIESIPVDERGKVKRSALAAL